MSTWKEFPLIHPTCTTRFSSIYRSMEEVLKNSPLIERVLNDDEFEPQRELLKPMVDIKALACLYQATSVLRVTMKCYDSDSACSENLVEDILDMVEALCWLENDPWKMAKGPMHAALIRKILIYVFGEHYFTKKRDIKSFLSLAAKSGINGHK